MPSSRRAFVAALLIVLSAAAQFAGDSCAVSCDHAHAAAEANAPSCHHQSAATPRLAQLPQRCGHDHAQLAAASSLPALTDHRCGCSMAAVLPSGRVADAAAIGAAVGPCIISPPRLPTTPLASSLRI